MVFSATTGLGVQFKSNQVIIIVASQNTLLGALVSYFECILGEVDHP